MTPYEARYAALLEIQKRAQFDEAKHQRNHGKFAHIAEGAAFGAAALAVGRRSAVGQHILIKAMGDEHYFNSLRRMSSPVQGVGRGMRTMMKVPAVRRTMEEQQHLKPIMSMAEESDGKHGIFHPDAYKHLEGKTHGETLENIENDIKGRKHEHGFIVAPNGKILSASRGNAYSTPAYVRKGWSSATNGKLTYTHNHPHSHGGDVVLSAQDIAALHQVGFHKIRAVTPNGLVSQVRVAQGVTKNESADYANRAINHAMHGQEDDFIMNFGHSHIDLENQKHIDHIADYQSKRMDGFYKEESEDGRFKYDKGKIGDRNF